MIKLNGVDIVPTIFPDKTSQVWHLPESLLEAAHKEGVAEVQWDFEYEGELMHVAQLKDLLDAWEIATSLRMPYLPYARQDKRVSNETTFALSTFGKLINAMEWSSVTVLDAHNNWRANVIKNLEDIGPKFYIEKAYASCGADLILYPDEGARKRYEAYDIGPSVHAEKVRNQATGEIEKVVIHGSVAGKKILIVDDLADAGRTFIEIAKLATANGTREIHLYVTHGLFTKGMQILRDACISRIFTWKGEIK